MSRRENIPADLETLSASRSVNKFAFGNSVDNAYGDWLDAYPASYHHFSLKAARRRADSRARAARRRARRPPKLTIEQQDRRGVAIARAIGRADAISARLRFGFRSGGGFVGGDRRYPTGPVEYRGLVSAAHPILLKFVQSTNRASKGLLTGWTKAEAAEGDSKLLGLDSAYVSVNSMMRSVLRVDLDADFAGFEAIEVACRSAGIPLPNLIAGYQRRSDGAILHPHLIWLLDAAVTFCGRGRAAPQALWMRVLRGLTHALASIGADPGGLSNALRVKNPLCPLWARHVATERPYGLAELASAVRLDVTDEELAERHPATLTRSADLHIDPEAGSQALFVALRNHARQVVDDFRSIDARGEFDADIASAALVLADRLGEPEWKARKTAASISEHIWTRWRARRPALPPEERGRRQSEGATARNLAQGEETLARLVDAFRQLAMAGRQPTQTAVAAAVGISERQARRHWPTVLSTVATPVDPERTETGHPVPYVKKASLDGRAEKMDDEAVPAPRIDNPVPNPPPPVPPPARPTANAIRHILIAPRLDHRLEAPSTPASRAIAYDSWHRSRRPHAA